MAEEPWQVDRKRLRTVLARIRAINGARLSRVRDGLLERQRPVLDLLPLLLHVNHPALPGYVSSQAPCTIAGYRPSPETVALARRQWRSFEPRAAGIAHIDALFLMGSPGTLGQSRASDLDVWICVPESLEPAALLLLQRKTTMLAAWARELGIEAHLFLMNGERFRRGEREALTGEDCGSAQHYLLLDEFYRSSILMAGKEPGWWAVPPGEESRHDAYLGRLTAQRYLRASEFVDFGGIERVPGGEFVGAGIWQLYKAIESPHKSVLKLLLFEVYASEYPEVSCLSAGFKRAVYAGVSDIDELDPYLMAYRRLEQHLQAAGQKDRLELVRRCLYLKAGVRLSQPAGPRPPWQRQLVGRLVEEWGWDKPALARLDTRARWGIEELAAERSALVKELVYSYRALAEFARRVEGENAIDARELSILGRKLHAAYERRAGKIDDLNTAGVADVGESEISFCALGIGQRNWGVWRGLVGSAGSPAGSPLRQSGCLLELLGWCLLNGVIDERTRLGSRDALDGLRHTELEALLGEVRAMLPGRGKVAPPQEDAFESPALPLELLVVANVAADPLARRQRGGLRDDAPGFGALREDPVLNIETLARNSWGELVASRYEGEEGYLRFLRELLALARQARERNGGELEIRVRSHCGLRAATISARLGDIMKGLIADLAAPGSCPDGRFVFASQGRLHLVQAAGGTSSAVSLHSEGELLRHLGEGAPRWRSLAIERRSLAGSPLATVAPQLAPGAVKVFCERVGEGGLRLLVADERGSLLGWQTGGVREPSALAALARFLDAVRFRQDGSVPARTPASFWLMLRQPGGDYELRPFAPAPASTPALLVQALAEHATDTGNGCNYTVYCEGEAFSQAVLGEDFGPTLGAHIRARRATGGDYPVYITELDLSALEASAPQPLQTIDYLRHRNRLEALLNAAGSGSRA